MERGKSMNKNSTPEKIQEAGETCVQAQSEFIDTQLNKLPENAEEQIKSKWIPCSERLPEKNKPVLGWYKDNPFSGYTHGIVMKTHTGWVFDYGNHYCSSVAAWMPLPEPYKEKAD